MRRTTSRGPQEPVAPQARVPSESRCDEARPDAHAGLSSAPGIQEPGPKSIRRYAPLAWLRVTLRQLEKPRRLRRLDTTEEASFRAFYADGVYVQVRFALALCFLAWASFGIWDVMGFPAVREPLLAIRYLLVAPIIGGLWWLAAQHPDAFKKRLQALLTIAATALSLGLILMMRVASGNDPARAFQLFWPAFAGLYFFLYGFLGLNFRPAAVLASITLIATAAFGVSSSADYHTVGSALFELAILHLLGMIVCARQEIHQRTLFRVRQHYLRQLDTARSARASAQSARDVAIHEGARAEAAILQVQEERAKLATVSAEKERFFSAAYHDLQQPLSIIGLYARLAKGRLRRPVHREFATDLTIIERAAHDIGVMFKGVRDICEIGNFEPAIEAVDLNAMLDDIERELGERACLKGLRLIIRKPGAKTPCCVESDRTLLKRALSNLVRNAIKYTDAGTVFVAATLLPGRVRIDVRDSGIGIAAEFQSRIFDEYFQIENPGRDRKRGLGLGLAIVRRIEHNLPDHQLRFHSEVRRGSRFSFYVPLARQPGFDPSSTVATAEALPIEQGLEGKYVVIVDDDLQILDGLIETVRKAGCIVDGAESEKKARQLFAERDRCPDLLITDYRLDYGQTGLDVARAMRERFEWATGTPVLFVTGTLLPHAAVGDFEGTHEVFRKPINPDELLAKVRDLVTPQRSC